MSVGAFVPDRDERFYLLKAHRQPLAENVAAAFVDRYTQPNDLVVDPFIASDAIVRVVLAKGRRILAADSNPLVAWTARTEATLPNAREIKSALVRLGEMPKEGETLATTVAKLYGSVCGECGAGVTIDYCVHRRVGDKSTLTHKVFTCEQCGMRSEDATESDRQRALDAAPRGLHYHVLVQRLLADEAAHTPLIKRLLALYTPRNLNALALVTQKLDAEFRQDPARNVLAALLLHALDAGTSLYGSPGAQLTREIPDEFIEVNIWRALEAAARGLSDRPGALRLASSAGQVLASSTPAAFIGQGGARYLADSVTTLNSPEPALILSSPARLDPSFWELSFLWTRWLLGKNAATPLQPLLDENNQRWGWYGEALSNAFAEMAKLAAGGTRCVVAFPSGSHAMIEALLLAASPSFALESFAFRPQRGMTETTEWGALRGDYRVVWRRVDAAPARPPPLQAIASTVRATSLQAAREILDERGEPLAYSWLHHAALDKLARNGVLAEVLHAKHRPGDNAFQFLRHRMEEGFKEGYIQDLDHWEEKGRVLWMRRESGGGGGRMGAGYVEFRLKMVKTRGLSQKGWRERSAKFWQRESGLDMRSWKTRCWTSFRDWSRLKSSLCRYVQRRMPFGRMTNGSGGKRMRKSGSHARSSLVTQLGERLGFQTVESRVHSGAKNLANRKNYPCVGKGFYPRGTIL